MLKIENQTYAHERALYGISNAEIINCKFQGEEDGESPLKETHDIKVDRCHFELRYPFWHVNRAEINNVELTEFARAAFWYDHQLMITNSQLHGIKALRECDTVVLEHCDILSLEFGWMSQKIQMKDCQLQGEYPFLHSHDLVLDQLRLKGKYSFQYVNQMVIRNSYLDTKDAFWHSNHVTVYDSVIKGEYLGWYSENLTLVRCKIIGTQPLCYCKHLILEDCEMVDTDLAFEKSEVQASIKGTIESIKNPISGWIQAETIGECILETETACKIMERGTR